MAPLIIPGFQVAEPDNDSITGLVISSTGTEKSGKTDWALRGTPGPLAYIGVSEEDSEFLVDQFAEGKRVLKKFISFPTGRIEVSASKSTYRKLWKQFEDAYYESLKVKELRTLVADNATTIWDLRQLAEFGKLSQNNKYGYGPCNADMKSVITAAKQSGKNVIFIHRSKKQYKGENWDGKSYERKGYGDMDFDCPVVLAHSKDKGGNFKVKVIDCKYDHSIEGQEWDVVEDGMGFAELAEEIFPEKDGRLWR